MARARRDALTSDLFDWQPPQVAAGFGADAIRGNRLASRISRAVARALKDCGLPREEIAAAMSADLGQQISVATLDAYASEAKESHKITLERFIALVEATGCHALLGFVAEPFDHVVVPARYADLIELHMIEEHEREIEQRKRALEAKYRWRR